MVAISVAYARVEDHVREIDQKVDPDVDEREEQDQALDGREVARQYRVDRKPAEAGYRIDRFGDDDAADQQGDADADDRGDGNCRV